MVFHYSNNSIRRFVLFRVVNLEVAGKFKTKVQSAIRNIFEFKSIAKDIIIAE